MFGVASVLSNTGCPYAGGEHVEFTTADVAALAKLICWGSSACTQFVVRLVDGRDVFVNASKQAKLEEKFLRKIAKRIPCRLPSRSPGWMMTWENA